MPAKDMKQFLHDFFNPPKFTKPTPAKKKAGKKKVKKKAGPSPIERQLMEADDFMKYKIKEFDACVTGDERVELAYKTIPDEATTIDRLWPTELMNKDSRIRRELSNKGKEAFLCRDFERALEHYNEAVVYSSGKGLAHTLARRGALLLQTQDHLLALRDLSLALQYGCLENELLDFLLDHHNAGVTSSLVLFRKDEMRYNRPVLATKENHWVAKLRLILDEIEVAKKKNSNEAKEVRDEKLEVVLDYIKRAETDINFFRNVETVIGPVPTLDKVNPQYPVLSQRVSVDHHREKGRHVIANADLLSGDLVAVETGLSTMLFPEKDDNLRCHCLYCYTFTKAPLPCENCCAVVFCSMECRDLAVKNFHRYECEMRLYELVPQEEVKMAPFFLALRTVTQHDLRFFIENYNQLEGFINQEEPSFEINNSKIYNSLSYPTMMNLVTHQTTMPEDVSMQISVISVYLLRFLQSGRYFVKHVPPKKKGDRSLHKHELMMLRLLHHLISVHLYNSQPLKKLISDQGKVAWERIGISLNTSIALVNHSCDPNTIVFHLGKQIVMVATRHITAGEEITVGYVPSYLTLELAQRDYQLLKNYVFQCECRACIEKWPLLDNLPDMLARIPNFDQERCYTVRHGDKKDICDEINSARWMADFGLTTNSFEVAQEALDALFKALDKHVRKPHLFFVEAVEMVEKIAISRYIGLSVAELTEIEETSTTEAPIENGSNSISDDINQVDWRVKDNHNGGIEDKRKSTIFERALDKILPDEDKIPGASKLIKAFESSKEKSSSPKAASARSRSPTLRMFSALEGKQNRKSVLERFEDSKMKSGEDAKVDASKAKRELVESMRRFPVKTDMAERMAAFQKSNKNVMSPVTKTRSTSLNRPEKEEKSVKNGIQSCQDLEQSEIANTAKKKKENSKLETISEDLRAFMEKDEKVQKSIVSREEKILSLKAKSIKKEEELSEKEKELMALRERTRRMLEKVKAKEDAFQETEKTFKKTVNQDPAAKKSMMDKILAKANEKAMQMKNEMRAARRKTEDDDNLLAFLRSSHKKGGNIYEFINGEVQDEVSQIENGQCSSIEPKKDSCHFDAPKRTNSEISVPDISIDYQETEDTEFLNQAFMANNVSNGHFCDTNKYNHYSHSKVEEDINAQPFMTIYKHEPTHESRNSPKRLDSREDINGSKRSLSPFLPHFRKSWDTQLEESIKKIEDLQNNPDYYNYYDSSNTLEADDRNLHYSERWSKSPSCEPGSRDSLSPETSKRSTPTLRPLNKPPIIVNGKLRTNKTNGKSQRNSYAEKPPYGALCRRKSLSDNCLVSKNKRQARTDEKELDAFGIPRLPRAKRSVSLMRETFVNKKQQEKENGSNLSKQKAISYETRTSSAAEFKSLFENGSAYNSRCNSRSSTPFRPPQVDPAQLSKIKNKFSEVKTDNLKLPFPNYGTRQPIPKSRPPPPPSFQ